MMLKNQRQIDILISYVGEYVDQFVYKSNGTDTDHRLCFFKKIKGYGASKGKQIDCFIFLDIIDMSENNWKIELKMQIGTSSAILGTWPLADPTGATACSEVVSHLFAAVAQSPNE